MALAIVTFAWAAVGPGDYTAFALICALSGIALGADLALPPALLARVIGRFPRRSDEGAYFGLWNFANKMNLALAAGLALPVLEASGTRPGRAMRPRSTRSPRLRRAALPSQTRRRRAVIRRVARPTLLGLPCLPASAL